MLRLMTRVVLREAKAMNGEIRVSRIAGGDWYDRQWLVAVPDQCERPDDSVGL